MTACQVSRHKKNSLQEDKMIKVAIMGYGTIGSGVYEILERNKEILTEKAGQEISVKYILDLRMHLLKLCTLFF